MAAINQVATYGGALALAQSQDGQVELDAERLMLVPGAYQVEPLTPFAPKTSQGDPDYGNFAPFDSPVAQSNWAGGAGFKRASHTISSQAWSGGYFSGYLEGLNVDPALPGRVAISPPIVLETLPGATGNPIKLRELGGTLICAAGNALFYRVDATATWLQAGAALPAAATDLEVFGPYAFVALGDATVMQYTSDLATWGTTSAARCLAVDKEGLFRAFGVNQVQGSTQGTAWTEAIVTVGGIDAGITSLAPGGGLFALFVGKTDALWGIPIGAGGTAAKFLPFDRRYAGNAAPLLWHGPLLLVPNGRGLWTFQPSSQTSGEAQNIAYDRDAGEIGRVRGEVRALSDSNRFIYAAQVDAAAGTAQGGTASYINRFDLRTQRWHTWLYPGAGVTVQALYLRPTQPVTILQGANPVLWFGSNRSLGRVTLPINGEDPVADASCRFSVAATDVELVTSEFDFGLPDEDKTLLTVRLLADNLDGSATKSIAVDYAVDSSGAWLSTLSPAVAYNSPRSELRFPGGVSCRRVAFRLRPRTTDATTSPLIRGLVIHGRVMVQNRWKWAITVALAQGETGENLATRTLDVFRIFRHLMRLRELATQVIYRDRDGYQWTVVVDDLGAGETRESGGTTPEYHVRLGLTQAVPGLAAGINNAFDVPTAGNSAATFDEEAYLD